MSARWAVPTLTCPPGATTSAAQWPGIGDGTSVVQDGTEGSCSSSGAPEYFAWYELFGDASVYGGNAVALDTSTYPVSPGDAITASVSISGATWTLSLNDTTKQWTFTFTTPSSTPALSQGSAEVMVECPGYCSSGSYGVAGLANFGAVRFTGVTADLNGYTAPITAFSPIAQQMTRGSTLQAAPGRLDPGGDFIDTWYAN